MVQTEDEAQQMSIEQSQHPAASLFRKHGVRQQQGGQG
jgi:hypothetical protein